MADDFAEIFSSYVVRTVLVRGLLFGEKTIGKEALSLENYSDAYLPVSRDLNLCMLLL